MTTILYPVFGRADRRSPRRPAEHCEVIEFRARLRPKGPTTTLRDPSGEGSASGGGAKRRRRSRS